MARPGQAATTFVRYLARSTIFLATYCANCWGSVDLCWALIRRSPALQRLVQARSAHWLGFVSGLSGGAAIAMEAPSRRLELTMYIFLYAIQSLYGCLQLPAVPHGDVGLFMASSAVLVHVYQHTPGHLRASYVGLFRYLVGDRRLSALEGRPS